MHTLSGIRFAVLAAVAIGLSCTGQTWAQEEHEDTIVVGSWNIQWLGRPERRPTAVKGVAQKPADIARYIRESDVDILGLIEICDDDGSETKRTNSTLDKAFQSLNKKKDHHWEYVLFEKRNPNDESQTTGIAWNKDRVSIAGDVYKIPVDFEVGGVKLWDRAPHAAKFRYRQGLTDVVVITVHMKSNVTSPGKTKDDLIAQREAEARSLTNTLDNVRQHYGDNDIVILGDTNVLHRDEAAIGVFEAAGFLDLNENDLSTVTKGKAPFDRIFVPSEQPEFVEDMYVVESWLDSTEYFRRLSDHYLIETSVVVSGDDD